MLVAEPLRLGAAPALALATLLIAGRAGAYCRTTTCDPRSEACEVDSTGCIVTGIPLVWPDRCLSFGTQKDGSHLRGIYYPEADRIFRGAFATWMAAECAGGAHPSFRMYDIGAPWGGIVCDQPEFNDSKPNASVWMFRDDAWPYYDDNATLGLTTVQYERNTGVILDADVEINSFGVVLSTSDTNIQSDLASIATHEAGHFLGLSHSNLPDATMNAKYQPKSLDIRSLHSDDIAGICAAYPPDRNVPECSAPYPPHGFSLYCGGGIQDPKNGCGMARRAREDADEHGSLAILLSAAAMAASVRRRTSKR